MPLYRGPQKLDELNFQGAKIGEAHRWDGTKWHKVFTSWLPYEFFTDFNRVTDGRLTTLYPEDWQSKPVANNVDCYVDVNGFVRGTTTTTDGTYFPTAFHTEPATSDNHQVSVRMQNNWNNFAAGLWVGSTGDMDGDGLLFQMHTNAIFTTVRGGEFTSVKTYTGASAAAGDIVTLRKEVVDGIATYTLLINGVKQDSWTDTDKVLPHGPTHRYGGLMVCFVRSFFTNSNSPGLDDFRLKSLPLGFVSPPAFSRRLNKSGTQTLPLNVWTPINGWAPVGDATVTDGGLEIPAGVKVTLEGQITVGTNLASGNQLGAQIVAGTEVIADRQITGSGTVVTVPATEWVNDTDNPVVVRLEGYVNSDTFNRDVVQSGAGTFLAGYVRDET